MKKEIIWNKIKNLHGIRKIGINSCTVEDLKRYTTKGIRETLIL